jgi:hypothetical protein
MKALEKRIKPIIDVNESLEEIMKRFFEELPRCT